MTEEMIEITVYADSTNQYTEMECDQDNLVYIELPRRIVFAYFQDMVAESYNGEITFQEWIDDYYTADDTADLWHYARIHGYEWHRSDEPKEYCDNTNGEIVEVCPHCEKEVHIDFWDINKDGFKAYCPYCGKRLMLCDACQHRFGDWYDDCDYCSAKDTCRFNKEGN